MVMGEKDFTAFAASSADNLLRCAFLLVGRRQDAEDLTQETLLRAFRSWGRVARAKDSSAYVHRIMLNLFLDARRADRTRPRTVPLDVPSLRSDDDAHSQTLEMMALASALDALSPQERAIVVLRYYSGLHHAEIAEALDVAPGTVRSSHSRALSRLREAIGTPRPPERDDVSSHVGVPSE